MNFAKIRPDVMVEQDLLAQAIATVEIAVIVLGHEGEVLLGNPAACSLMGYEPDQMTGTDITSVLPSLDRAFLDAHIVPPANSVILHDVAGLHRNNVQRHFNVHVIAWNNPDAPARHTLMLREMTEELAQKRARNAELERAQNAIRGARIGVFEFDTTTKEAHVSDIWRDLMELPRDEIVDVQKEWRTRVHPDDLDAADAPMRRLAQGLESRTVSEYRLFTRDRRELRWIRTNLSVAQRDEKGNPTRIVGAQVDVTDRKATELALRKSMDQFQSAFDNAPIGKAIMTLDGKLLEVNPAFCAIVGQDKSVLMGKGLAMILHPDEIAETMMEMERLKSGYLSNHQAKQRFLHRNGQVIWGLLSIAAVRDEDGQVVQFIAQVVNVSEQHRLQDLKSEFVATVSHELRTPLTSILGALKLLQAQAADQDLPDPMKRLIEISLQNADRLGTLVGDILDFERFSKGNLDIETGDHDLAELIEAAVEESRPLAESYRVAVATDLRVGSLHCPVEPARICQIMSNLLSNAAKFADSNTTVEVILDRRDDMARVVVRNRGRGIPEAFRSTIFLPFAQAAPTLTRDHGGTGLGLSICKQIVEHLGGEIGFISVPGDYTDFWFTLPLSESQQ